MGPQNAKLFPLYAPMGRNHLRLLLALLVLLVLLVQPLLTSHAGSELVNRKISGTMPAFGEVDSWVEFQISPDSRTVVYVADAQTDEAFELYSVPIDGRSAPVRLSGLLPVGTSIQGFEIASDSSRVVYRAAQDTLGVVELYSVPLEGGVDQTERTPDRQRERSFPHHQPRQQPGGLPG